MIYIDTANIDVMLEMSEYPWIKGFTTNPELLHQEGMNSLDLLKELPSNFHKRVFIQLEGKNESEMILHYKKIKTNIQDRNIGLKIPLNQEGIHTIRHVRRLDSTIPILATAVYSSNQGMFAGILECDYVAPYYNRIENEGYSAKQVITDTRSFFESQGLHTQILAASFKNISQVQEAFKSGTHSVTLSPEVYRSFYENKASEKDITSFNSI